MDELASPVVPALVGAVILLSLGLWARLLRRVGGGQPLIPYQPRKPAPWNALAPVIMLAPLLGSFHAALSTTPPPAPPPELTVSATAQAASAVGASPGAAIAGAASSEAARVKATTQSIAGALWMQSLITLAMGLGCYAMLVIAYRATPTDLGLPADANELRSDAALGLRVWLASIAPTYLLMYLLQVLFQPTSGHPLVQSLLADRSLGVMLAAMVAAVVAAPIYEETVFRLTFQGWLQRRDMLRLPVQVHEPALPPTESAEGVDSQCDWLASDRPVLAAAHPTYSYSPPGWAPILISGVAFGLAHYGHGVAPVPLILLGVILGYVYRQTHRIVPCIVCHAAFNAFTFLQLALQLAASP
jgi:membrane protease YdiL (CAAX protease family)